MVKEVIVKLFRGPNRFLVGTMLGLMLGMLGMGVASADNPDGGQARVFYLPNVVNVAQRNRVARTGALILEVGKDYVLVEAIPAEVDALRAEKFVVEAPPDKFKTPQDFPGNDSNYHNYDEMVTVLQQTASKYPAIFSLFRLGTSYEGRDIWAGKISDNVGTDEDEPEVLITNHQHAREHLTVEMGLYVLKMLTDDYGIDPTVTALVNSREIWIVFDMNPDGGEYDVATGRYAFWRKNRQPNEGSEQVGTDLNRNWDYKWGCCNGSSGNPASETYRGAAAFSAPETQVVRDFVNSRVVSGKQQIATMIDFHTYGELVMWPYGYTDTDVPADMTQDDWAVHVGMGTTMAQTNGYTPEQSSDLYTTDGTIDDWTYGVYKIFSYTFEMFPNSNSGIGFYPSDELIGRETARNRQAVLYLLEYSNCPYRVIGKETSYCGLTTTTSYAENFDVSKTWTVNPDGTDTATSGKWQIAKPQVTNDGGVKQVAAQSGTRDLVTGPRAGTNANARDVDGGVTTARSAPITLSDSFSEVTLSFEAYMAHGTNSTKRDYFRVKVIGDTTQTVYEELGSKVNDNAGWIPYTVDLSAFKGQTIWLQVECADRAKDSLVECGMDSVMVRGIAEATRGAESVKRGAGSGGR